MVLPIYTASFSDASISVLEAGTSVCWKGDLLGSKAFECVLQGFSAEGIIQK